MTFFQATVLGIVQGLTEFLPVSSTAHLILVPWLLGWHIDPQAQFVFDILLQFGTTLAVIVYFARDLWTIALAMLNGLRAGKPFESVEARMGWLVGLATVPAGLSALLFKDVVEDLHHQPLLIAVILILAAGFIFLVEWVGKRNRGSNSLNWIDALIVGCSQALALIPGVSRSAATISAGLVMGLDRPTAARFSFLMSIPVLLGASLIATKDLVEIPNFTTFLPALALGVTVGGVVGFFSIHWLLNWLAKRSMQVFAWYRIAFGVLCLAVAFWPR